MRRIDSLRAALIVTLAVTSLLNCSRGLSEPPSPVPPAAVSPPTGDFRKKVFYQLWVRSFQDSDGDGIGDLRGTLQRLDELADLGIGGIWLMPTFPSPLADSGYDVADYRGVHPDYGTVTDMVAFVEAAHAHGIEVWLDMVFNHTSNEHRWFRSALTGPASPYFDYYVWANQPLTRCTDIPPGPFGDERWTLVPELGRYYFHQFYPRQPDLNFRNPKVQAELLDVLSYWLALGIDGFRFDVPDRYFEEGDRCSHTEATIAFHRRLRERITGVGSLEHGFVGEIWGTPSMVKRYFGPDKDPVVFNFTLLGVFYTAVAVGESPAALAEAVEQMLTGLPEESRWGLVVGNHDTPRIASVAGEDPRRLRLLAALQLTLPGIPFIWMGEELGLTMGEEIVIDWRDGARTPYPWNTTTPGYGFTTALRPHLAFSSDSGRKAWARQRPDPGSLLNWYRRLISLRNAHPALHAGDYALLEVSAAIYAFRRATADESLLVVHNLAWERSVIWSPPRPGTYRDLLTGEWFPPGPIPIAASGTRILQRSDR